MTTYRTFKRSARGWREFAGARKITVDRGLTYDEAFRACEAFNASRTPAQKRRGTKLEFIREDTPSRSRLARRSRPLPRVTAP